jgi:hypothetical protein
MGKAIQRKIKFVFFLIKGTPVPDFKLIKPHTEQGFTTTHRVQHTTAQHSS